MGRNRLELVEVGNEEFQEAEMRNGLSYHLGRERIVGIRDLVRWKEHVKQASLVVHGDGEKRKAG